MHHHDHPPDHCLALGHPLLARTASCLDHADHPRLANPGLPAKAALSGADACSLSQHQLAARRRRGLPITIHSSCEPWLPLSQLFTGAVRAISRKTRKAANDNARTTMTAVSGRPMVERLTPRRWLRRVSARSLALGIDVRGRDYPCDLERGITPSLAWSGSAPVSSKVGFVSPSFDPRPAG